MKRGTTHNLGISLRVELVIFQYQLFYKTMLGRSCLGTMLVELAIDGVDLSVCYVPLLSRPALSRPMSYDYETLV